MNADAAIAEMERMFAHAESEQRAFSEEEAARFAELKLIATVKGNTMQDDATTAPPAARLRPVAGATRSLTDAARADGLFARMLQAGRARMEIPVDVRALGSTQADNPAPGYPVQPANLGPVGTYHGIVNRLLSALASIPITGTNAVTYTRVTYSPTNASPAMLGNAAKKVQELTAKPQSELDTEEVTQPLDTYAHWLPCSKQVLDDVTGLRALLDGLLVQGLLDKTDAQIYTDMTTAGRYTAFSPTGAIVGDNVARIVTALLTKGATSVKVAMNPLTMLGMMLAKASTAGTYLGLPPGIQATMVASASVAENKLLAWSDTGTVWANREGVSVVAGLNSDDFVKNKVTLLAEHRGAVLTLDPAHVYFGNSAA
jgi:HK97 family phage major capsid protein